MLTAVSVAAHGLVLGLPMPDAEQTEPPETRQPEPEQIMDVAVLPEQALAPTAAAPEPETTRSKASRDPQQPVVAARSPQSANPMPIAPPSPEAAILAESAAPPETAATPPPVDTDLDVLGEMPIDPGSSDLTENEPPAPLTLAQQLQNPAAYQFDGRKSLGFLEVTQALQGWVAEGQPLPSKVDPLEVPYQLADECLDPAPQLGLLAVIMAPDGTFLQGPEVISSTGYALLDDHAKAMVEAGEYTFPDRDQAKAYSVEIKVLYPADCR